MFKLSALARALALAVGILSYTLPEAFAQESVDTEQSAAIRMERPVVISVDFGFPKGLGLSALYNIQPEWAVGATAAHVLLWPSLGVFGRYFLEPQKISSPFAEWRLYAHPGVVGGAYLLAPYVSTHLLYGWETRAPQGYYSHFAFGLGIGNSTTEGLLLGFVNFEFSFGGSIQIEK
jgi:hypothetical protein